MSKDTKKIIGIAVAFIACFALIVIILNSNNSKVSKEDNQTTTTVNVNNTTTSTTTKTTTTVKLDEKETNYVNMLVAVTNLISKGKAFDTGSYAKGDIPKGEYAFVSLGSGSKYYEEEDLSGNIIDNENFDSFGYVKVHGKGDITTRGVLISVDSFKELGVSGAKEIYEKLNKITNYNEAGYYKVGSDITAGTYIIESYGSGYYAVMSGPVGNSDIVRNDNFNGKKTVTVKNGQYLEVSRSEITKK